MNATTMNVGSATLAVRDEHQRGVLWMYSVGDWEPVVFERTGNRSLGRFADADSALRVLREAMDCPRDIKLPPGWDWERVRAARAQHGIGGHMVPEVTITGVCSAWGHVNWVRNHVPAMHA